MKRWMCALAAAALAAGAGTASAQQTDGLRRPAGSLSLGFFAGPELALGRRLSATTDVGLAVTAQGDRVLARYSSTAVGVDERANGWKVTVEPSIKHYVGAGGPLMPYAYASLLATYGRTDLHQEGDPAHLQARAVGIAGSLGLGADWFVAPRVSVGGRAVLDGGLGRVHGTSSSGTSYRQHGWFAETGRSGMQVTFHF